MVDITKNTKNGMVEIWFEERSWGDRKMAANLDESVGKLDPYLVEKWTGWDFSIFTRSEMMKK